MGGWFTPDNFRADWYGYASNQFSHTAIGIGSATLAAIFWFQYWAEYPPQEVLFAVVMMVFLLGELAQVGNKFADAVEDLLFCGYGTYGVSFGFSEQTLGLRGLDPNFSVLISTAVFFSFHMALGSVRRWKQARRAERR